MEEQECAFRAHVICDDAAWHNEELWLIVLKADQDVNEAGRLGALDIFSDKPGIKCLVRPGLH